MNLLNFARMYWQLKDYNFKGSSVHIINILKGHILPYSIIWRTRSLKSEWFLPVQKKFYQHYHFRNQHAPIHHLWEYFPHSRNFCEMLSFHWVTVWSLLLVPTRPPPFGVKEQSEIPVSRLLSCNVDIAIPKSAGFPAALFLMATHPASARNKKNALSIFWQLGQLKVPLTRAVWFHL